MPDRLDFNSARRVLEEIAPTDTWHEARLRAEAGSVQLDAEDATVSPLRAPSHRSRTIRLVSVAACLLAVVAVAAVVTADREAVDTIGPAETPSTSPERITTEQYGAVVSEHSTAIQAWIDREEASDHIEDSFPQYVRERYDELRQLLAQFQLALHGLPPPPDEIATLVDATERQVSDALHSVGVLLTCPEPSRVKCPDEYSEAEAAYKALTELFAAWGPYTEVPVVPEPPTTVQGPPAQDVSISSCRAESGVATVTLDITNRSSSTSNDDASDYIVRIRIEDGSGEKIGEAVATIDGVFPGETMPGEAVAPISGDDSPEGPEVMNCFAEDVKRVASAP